VIRAFAAVNALGHATLVHQELTPPLQVLPLLPRLTVLAIMARVTSVPPSQVSASMDRVRVFIQHIAHAADQLVTVVLTLASTTDSPSEMCHVRIGCCSGPFQPAVGACVGEHTARISLPLALAFHAMPPISFPPFSHV
jgi:hypothetical protein